MDASYEYLIQWLEDEPEWGPDRQTIIRPNTVASTPYAEDNDFGLILAEGRFSFSAEPPGLQVIFYSKDGSPPPPHDSVTGWVQEICDNIVRASGLPAKVLVEDGEIWSF